jgi:hypothetical protein
MAKARTPADLDGCAAKLEEVGDRADPGIRRFGLCRWVGQLRRACRLAMIE